MLFRFDPESVEQRLCIRLCFPAVHLRELCLQFTGPDTVFIGEVRFRIKRILFLHDLKQTRISHHDCVQDLFLIVFKMVLLQYGQTLSRSNVHTAVGRLKLSGQNLEKSRFSGTVGTDDTIAVSLRKLDVDILKQGFFPDSQRHIVSTDHVLS